MSKALIIVGNNKDRELAATWCRKAPHGCRIEFAHSTRTLPQNAYLWACLTQIARKVDWYGQKLTAEEWKDVFTASLRNAKVVPGLDGMTLVPLGMRTSKMSKQTFSDLIELIHAFAAERGIVLGPEGDAEATVPENEKADALA